MSDALNQLRKQYEENYTDMDFNEFKELYRKKFYADLDPTQFDQALGITPEPSPEAPSRFTSKLRMLGQGLTFGGADEAEAFIRSWLGEGTYEQERDKIRSEIKQFQQDNPGTALTGEILGGLLTPATYLKAPQYIERLGVLVRGGIKGGVGGAAYGFGTAEGDFENRAQEALESGGIGLLIGAPLEKAFGAVGNAKANALIKRQQQEPTVDTLRAIKDAAYEAVDDKAFAVGPGELQNVFVRMSGLADNAGFLGAKENPGIHKVKATLQQYISRNQGLTLGQSEVVRKRLFDYMRAHPEDSRIIREMIDEFDTGIEAAMDASQIATVKLARDANRRFRNVETIQNAFEGIAPDVKDTRKAWRTVAQRLLNDKKKMRYFNQAEQGFLQDIVTGSVSERTLATLGKFQFNPMGFFGAMNVMAIAHQPFLGLVYLATGGAKYIADKKTKQSIARLVKEAGGIEELKKVTGNPNQATLTVGGVTADSIRNVLFGEEEEE
jgi:hypothetical protein